MIVFRPEANDRLRPHKMRAVIFLKEIGRRDDLVARIGRTVCRDGDCRRGRVGLRVGDIRERDPIAVVTVIRLRAKRAMTLNDAPV